MGCRNHVTQAAGLLVVALAVPTAYAQRYPDPGEFDDLNYRRDACLLIVPVPYVFYSQGPRFWSYIDNFDLDPYDRIEPTRAVSLSGRPDFADRFVDRGFTLVYLHSPFTSPSNRQLGVVSSEPKKLYSFFSEPMRWSLLVYIESKIVQVPRSFLLEKLGWQRYRAVVTIKVYGRPTDGKTLALFYEATQPSDASFVSRRPIPETSRYDRPFLEGFDGKRFRSIASDTINKLISRMPNCDSLLLDFNARRGDRR